MNKSRSMDRRVQRAIQAIRDGCPDCPDRGQLCDSHSARVDKLLADPASELEKLEAQLVASKKAKLVAKYSVGQIVSVHLAVGVWHVGRVVAIELLLGAVIYRVRFLFHSLREIGECCFWGNDIKARSN